uniref:Cobalamin adenosyltransferase-like domain-containing protein n=1 Tax=viral metagenome TaxID=1070528 RepID=A0A6C0I891_9ZZZZ
MKIYTKTGDNGSSSLYTGSRKSKSNIIFKFLGDFDELNSNLAMVKAFHKELLEKETVQVYNAPGAGAMFYKDHVGVDSGKYYEWFALSQYIYEIQVNIMDISAFIATPAYSSDTKVPLGLTMDDHLEKWNEKVGFDEVNYQELEKYIDRLNDILPKLTNFVVPSGNKLLAQIHICRSICRRCERTFVDLYETEYREYIGVFDIIDRNVKNVRIYLNRLSDYLFMLSRFVGMTLNIEEDLYKRVKKTF